MRRDDHIFCNMCGKKIMIKNGILAEEVLSVKKAWGYFSKRDGICSEFDLCEECCERVMEQFVIPASETEQKELL